MEEYGLIHAINLLGQKENEASLTNEYARHLQIARAALGDDLGITHFDFHNAVRIGGHDNVIRDLKFVMSDCHRFVFFFSTISLNRRIENIVDNVDKFGFTMCDSPLDDIVTDQKGVFRTNCLDW